MPFAEACLFGLADNNRSIIARALRPSRRVSSAEGRGAILRATALTVLFGIILSGCTTDEIPRLPRPKAELIDARRAEEAQAVALRRALVSGALALFSKGSYYDQNDQSWS
jgi:hypothetical protein